VKPKQGIGMNGIPQRQPYDYDAVSAMGKALSISDEQLEKNTQEYIEYAERKKEKDEKLYGATQHHPENIRVEEFENFISLIGRCNIEGRLTIFKRYTTKVILFKKVFERDQTAETITSAVNALLHEDLYHEVLPRKRNTKIYDIRFLVEYRKHTTDEIHVKRYAALSYTFEKNAEKIVYEFFIRET
jgi:hypothetical protein